LNGIDPHIKQSVGFVLRLVRAVPSLILSYAITNKNYILLDSCNEIELEFKNIFSTEHQKMKNAT